MKAESEKGRVGFTLKEIKALRYYAIIMAALGAMMCVIAPKGVGQLLGVLLAALLLPLPPLLIFLLRRRKAGK